VPCIHASLRAAVCVESGFHSECRDYDSTFRQAEFPSDWLENENRSKLTLRRPTRMRVNIKDHCRGRAIRRLMRDVYASCGTVLCDDGNGDSDGHPQ